MLGFQRRGVRRCECDTLLPKPGPLPHTSQTEATGSLHWVVVRWIIGPVWADSVVEGYPTSVPERDLAHGYPAGMAAAAAIDVRGGEVALSLPHTSQTEATGSLHWVVVRWIIGLPPNGAIP